MAEFKQEYQCDPPAIEPEPEPVYLDLAKMSKDRLIELRYQCVDEIRGGMGSKKATEHLLACIRAEITRRRRTGSWDG